MSAACTRRAELGTVLVMALAGLFTNRVCAATGEEVRAPIACTLHRSNFGELARRQTHECRVVGMHGMQGSAKRIRDRRRVAQDLVVEIRGFGVSMSGIDSGQHLGVTIYLSILDQQHRNRAVA